MVDADVIIVGGGNAGFCAAHAAVDRGRVPLVLEKAPRAWEGGNSYFTQGSFRTTLAGLDDIRDLLHDQEDPRLDITDVPPYTPDSFLADMRRVTHGRCDPALTDILVNESNQTLRWLHGKGLKWELAYDRRAFKVDGRWRFWGGGALRTVGLGIGLIEQHTEALRRDGVTIRYGTAVTGLLRDERGAVLGVEVETADGPSEIRANAVVLASGGFGANPRWRAAYLGPSWDLAKVRGTPYNTGDGLQIAIDNGAQPFGNWSGCHSVSWDAEAPADRGDRELTNRLTRSSYQLGIVVNINAERFLDEGADLRTNTYAKYGAEVLKQPQATAFHLFDAKTRDMLNPEYDYTVGEGDATVSAETIEELASELGLDPARLEATIERFNEAVQDGEFDPTQLDGKSTLGMTPPKSNWALPLATPPFYGTKVTCGITFTYGGIAITTKGEVLGRTGEPIPGLFSAGEMVGGLFYQNYPGGTGLMSGGVFGRRAGTSAAAYAER